MVNDLETFASDGPMEKDETEKELENLVFGDDLGFHEGLKSSKDANDDLRHLVNGDQQQAQEGLEEVVLEGLDDADVCIIKLSVGLASAQHSSSCSSLTPFRPL